MRPLPAMPRDIGLNTRSGSRFATERGHRTARGLCITDSPIRMTQFTDTVGAPC
jgi:hypothetical protein